MRTQWLAFLAVLACGTPTPPYPVASCELTLWYKPSSSLSRVEAVTSWENWQTGLHVLDDAGQGWRATRVTPPTGEVEYAFIDDGVWLADPLAPTTAFHDETEVTLLFESDCSMPSLAVTSPKSLAFTSANDGAALDPASIDVSGDTASMVSTDDMGDINLAFDSLAPGKHVFEVSARDLRGRPATARLTAWNEPRAWDWNDAVIYQVMVDRYRGPSGALAAPNPISAFAGGTLAGLTANLDAIASLGVNAIWVSPLYENPAGTFPGTDGREYSAYHGYWPKASRSIDARFGAEADVDAFIAAAHARDMRVIFDVVPHHVHQEHPYVTAHPGSPWFTDWTTPSCVCGVGACDWNTHVRDCWFETYLPTFDWHDLDVADTVTDDVAWWIDRFDADGLRIDAVPMMPRAANRRIVDAVRRRFDHPGQRTYIVGENFVGPIAYTELRYDLGSFGLDGEFDFPMMWAIRYAIAEGGGAMSTLDLAEHSGEAAWAGSGAVMARMIGNHDVTRFSSVSAGDADGDGWTPAVQSTDPLVYAKQRMALALSFTLPGAAVVYYGDEIGLAGRQDPDSRRVMPADAALNVAQLATRAFTATLGKTRACSDALRRGAYRTLVADVETLAFAREARASGVGDDAAIVIVARNPTAPVTLPTQGLAKGMWRDALGTGLAFDTSSPTVAMPQQTVAVFVPDASACGR